MNTLIYYVSIFTYGQPRTYLIQQINLYLVLCLLFVFFTRSGITIQLLYFIRKFQVKSKQTSNYFSVHAPFRLYLTVFSRISSNNKGIQNTTRDSFYDAYIAQSYPCTRVIQQPGHSTYFNLIVPYLEGRKLV